MKHLNSVSREFVKNVLVTVAMVAVILAVVLACKIYYIIRKKCKLLSEVKNRDDRITFLQRMSLTYVKILLFGYKNMATFSIIILNCTKLLDKNVLFINGEVQCYRWWQWLDLLFLLLWVIPFPIAVLVSYRILMLKKLHFTEFLMCCTFPLLVIPYY